MTKEQPSFKSRYTRRAWSLVESSIAGMDDEQMTWAPQGKWSSANLLEHLSRGFMITAKGCKVVLEEGLQELPRQTRNQHWLSFRIIELDYFPMRVIAPKAVCPRGQSPKDVKTSLLKNMLELDEILTQCGEKYGRRVDILAHPYLGPLTVRQWDKFTLFHVRRHTKQISALRQKMSQLACEHSPAPVSTLSA